jgi:hypothetical protein
VRSLPAPSATELPRRRGPQSWACKLGLIARGVIRRPRLAHVAGRAPRPDALKSSEALGGASNFGHHRPVWTALPAGTDIPTGPRFGDWAARPVGPPAPSSAAGLAGRSTNAGLETRTSGKRAMFRPVHPCGCGCAHSSRVPAMQLQGPQLSRLRGFCGEARQDRTGCHCLAGRPDQDASAV